jgi:hypothetical protein
LLPQGQGFVQINDISRLPVAEQVGTASIVPSPQAEALISLGESRMVQDAFPGSDGFI